MWQGAKRLLNARFLLHSAWGGMPASNAMPFLLKVWLMVKSWRQPSLRGIMRGCCTQVPCGLEMSLAVPAILLLLLLHVRLPVPVRLRIGGKPSLSWVSRLALQGEGSWGVAVLMEPKVLLLMRPCLISQAWNACLVSHAGVSWQPHFGRRWLIRSWIRSAVLVRVSVQA